jgi:hypothetical protein
MSLIEVNRYKDYAGEVWEASGCSLCADCVPIRTDLEHGTEFLRRAGGGSNPRFFYTHSYSLSIPQPAML